MIFELFHSISDPIIAGKNLGPKQVIENFLFQANLAESLGMKTIWLAESHFSSEVQKRNSMAAIPKYYGEIGLNTDAFQLMHLIVSRTKKIGLGTAIHNIVGGSGGPIASADRVNFLNFINHEYWNRQIHIGVASGRFPYQNLAFDLGPRSDIEIDLWPVFKRAMFTEALEIFLRLLKGEVVASEEIGHQMLTEKDLGALKRDKDRILRKYRFPYRVKKRWKFEPLQLVPHCESFERLRVVLGSTDPWALEVATKLWDVDLFNLSFTSVEKLNETHKNMISLCDKMGRQWHRGRMPRTVMIFCDPSPQKARALADSAIDAYIEGMRGTAHVPDKEVLLSKALIGNADEIKEQLDPANSRGFNSSDRLMLWFEFNQLDCQKIAEQMIYFHEHVARDFSEED